MSDLSVYALQFGRLNERALAGIALICPLEALAEFEQVGHLVRDPEIRGWFGALTNHREEFEQADLLELASAIWAVAREYNPLAVIRWLVDANHMIGNLAISGPELAHQCARAIAKQAVLLDAVGDLESYIREARKFHD